jgi:hypothetical protein
MSKEVTPAAIEASSSKAAQQMENAVNKNDPRAWDAAMDEVNKTTSGLSPEQKQQYVAGVTKKLEEDHVLPRVALFEVQRDYDKLDVNGVDGKGDKALQQWELGNRQVKHNDQFNDVQKELIGSVEKNFDKLHGSYHPMVGRFLTPQDVKADIASEKQKEDERASLVHLLTKNKDGLSLYDKLPKDADGNIASGGIAQLKNLGQLSDEDKKALDFLSKKDIKDGSERKICQEYGVDFDKLAEPKERVEKRQALANFFAKRPDGTSLYDQMTDQSGNIKPGKINGMLDLDAKNASSLGLTDQDRASLKLLKENMGFFRNDRFFNLGLMNDMNKGQVQELCKKYGLDYDKLKKGDTSAAATTGTSDASGAITSPKKNSDAGTVAGSAGAGDTPVVPGKAAVEMDQREADEKANKKLLEKARKEGEEIDRKEAAEKAQKEAAEKAQKEAAEKAQKEAAEKAQKEAAEKAQKEAAEKAQKEAAEKAQKEAEKAAKARAEFQKKVEEEVKKETTLPPLQKGEGYYQALERAHPDWDEDKVRDEARRIKRDVYKGATDLSVGQELRTVTNEQEQQLIAQKMAKYDADSKLAAEAKARVTEAAKAIQTAEDRGMELFNGFADPFKALKDAAAKEKEKTKRPLILGTLPDVYVG